MLRYWESRSSMRVVKVLLFMGDPPSKVFRCRRLVIVVKSYDMRTLTKSATRTVVQRICKTFRTGDCEDSLLPDPLFAPLFAGECIVGCVRGFFYASSVVS